MSLEEVNRGPGRAPTRDHQESDTELECSFPPHPILQRVPGVWWGLGLNLTQTRMEKKEKAMAALALLLPRRNSLGCECCHWLARKQNPTNQMPAQRTAVWGEKRDRGVHRVGLGALRDNFPLVIPNPLEPS